MATKRICSVENCGKPHYALSYCGNHYHRFRTHGSPTAGGTERGAPLRWIFEHSQHTDEGDCLFWPFSRGRNGYGIARYLNSIMGAHRVMCFIAHGEPPHDKGFACHSCGNGTGGCVNPKHIRWASRDENMQDAVIHGSFRGERHAKAKLTEENIRQIRALRGTIPARQIAQRYGVARTTISQILTRRNWEWVA